jgi:O-antigen/teichoic acid export membrane protein
MTVPGVGLVAVLAPRRNALAVRSVWLVLAKCLQMGSGFLFWVVAARGAQVETVGVAAACVSGVMLCTQLGILGTGSAVIIALSRGEPAKDVLDTAFTVLGVASLLAASGYLGLTALVGSDALAGTQTLGFTLLFTAAAFLGTLVICLDQASIALQHAGGAATRYGAGGLAALGTALVVSLRDGDMTATALLACWTMGNVVAALVGVVQLRRWVGYRYSPAVRVHRVLWVLRVGVPNQLLTATERLSPVLVPIVLTHFASPTTTAYWYPAWMMAWVAFNVPISVGLVQFNDIVKHPGQARTVVRQGVMWSLMLGGVVSLVAAAAADPLLSVLGDGYADASVTALRVLLLGLLPFTILQAYNALCRGAGHTGEAIALGLGLMVAVAVGTALVGERGPTAVAVLWLSVSSVAALWALWRLRVTMRVMRLHEEPAHD